MEALATINAGFRGFPPNFRGWVFTAGPAAAKVAEDPPPPAIPQIINRGEGYLLLFLSKSSFYLLFHILFYSKFHE